MEKNENTQDNSNFVFAVSSYIACTTSICACNNRYGYQAAI